MFDLDPGDDLALLIDTTRGFGADALIPALREAEAARAIAPEVREAYRQIGLAGLELPEALGGVELGTLARVLVNEELGAADAGAALALDPLGPCAGALLEFGGPSALERVAPDGDGGGRWLLVDERDAELEVVGDRVSGSVPWVPADDATGLVVVGDEGGFVVREGLSFTALRGTGLRAAGASALAFDGALIAERWADPAAAERARARARLYVASLLVGVMRAACDFSREYALQREAFGRPIAHHQALAFLITDMQMALDGARLLVHDAAFRVDAGRPSAGAAAGAFAEAIEAARSIGPSGVQILGGHGFMQDYPVEKFMREAAALASMVGGFDAARDDAGAELVALAGPVELSCGERA